MREYFERVFHIHISTSGIFMDPPLRCAIDTLGADEVMFAIDHPFSGRAIAPAGSMRRRPATTSA